MDKVPVYISGLKITFQIGSTAKLAFFFVAAISPECYPRWLFSCPKTASHATESVTQSPISHIGFQTELSQSREMV